MTTFRPRFSRASPFGAIILQFAMTSTFCCHNITASAQASRLMSYGKICRYRRQNELDFKSASTIYDTAVEFLLNAQGRSSPSHDACRYSFRLAIGVVRKVSLPCRIANMTAQELRYLMFCNVICLVSSTVSPQWNVSTVRGKFDMISFVSLFSRPRPRGSAITRALAPVCRPGALLVEALRLLVKRVPAGFRDRVFKMSSNERSRSMVCALDVPEYLARRNKVW
ncbi:hypothetical protein PYCC9005_006049 [Savitreella phatthalungensis]